MKRLMTLALAALWIESVTTGDAQDASNVGTLQGKASFAGKAPKRRKIDTSADAACHKMHEEQPLQVETVIVNDNGTLRNVFVYIKKGLGDRKFEPPSTPATLDQKGCQYVPHVQGMMVGQKLIIRNGDDTMHNIHATGTLNPEFNFSQAKQGQENEKVFNCEEIMVPFKCDVHGWMNSYIGVLRHPFFAVTGEDGSFEIKGLPPGEYTVEAWHEKFGAQEQVVKVEPKGSAAIEFKFEGK